MTHSVKTSQALLPLAVVAIVSLTSMIRAGEPMPVEPKARFVGTWVGVQSWALEDPSPRHDQPVTLQIEVNEDGKVTGSMKPFLGGDEGATFVTARVVGDELRASAVIARPKNGPAGTVRSGRGGRPGDDEDVLVVPGRGPLPRGWKEASAVSFTFRQDGRGITGLADVRMGEVHFMKLRYELSKKRAQS